MAAAYPSGTNTFVPQFDASGHLVVSFARNPKDFPLNQYVTITPVKKGQGYYLSITAEQAARILNSDAAEHIWNDGNDAPNLSWGNESFQFVKYETVRFLYGFRMGWKSVEQADWQIIASHAAISAQQAMTYRAMSALAALTTTANFDASHTSTATSLGGGTWGAGDVPTPYIKKSILNMAKVVQQDTLGVVGMKDMCLVVNPTLAILMADSAELQNLIKSSPFAYPWMEGQKEITSGRWGLPEYLYGAKVVVEDTVKVTSSKKAASKTIGYALGQASSSEQALLVARPGQLTSQEGAVSFSTCHIFSYEEMKVETKDDPDNRRTVGRIVDDFTTQIVASASGYILTGCS